MNAERPWLEEQMRVRSAMDALPVPDVRAALDGLPEAHGYELTVRPLRYRTEPHLSALTVFDERTITISVPEPFLPFGETVPYGAVRAPGKSMRFVPMSEGVTFRARAEVVRFLYCHEWYHWFLYEIRQKGWSSETACDRFALYNYRRRRVSLEDAHRALRRERDGARPTRAAAKTPRLPGDFGSHAH